MGAWSREDPRRRQGGLAAVWLPHHLIGRLRARLAPQAEREEAATAAASPGGGGGAAAATAAGTLLSRLDTALAAHMELAAHDSLRDPSEMLLPTVSPVAASGRLSPSAFGGGGGWFEALRPSTPTTVGFGFDDVVGMPDGGAAAGPAPEAPAGGFPSPFFGGGRGLDALSPPPPSFAWLPPPIASLGT